jgi:ABC-2 type transport system permease protein
MFLAIYRKTLGDLSDPKSLVTYLVAFTVVLFFLSLGFMNEVPAEVATLPLTEQEVELLAVYTSLSWFWGVGLGLLTAGSLFVALTLATEAERGTLDLVLSKPVRRWTVLLAVLLANVTFLFVVGVAGLLLSAVALYEMGGFSAAALGRGVFDVLPAMLVYTLAICVLVAAVGTASSVVTRNRLQTAALTAVIPVLFFAMFVARAFPGSIYEDYSLYLIDMSYHLGNVYVLLLDTIGDPLPVEVQAQLGFWTGVYELPAEQESLPESLELIGYVDPAVSLALYLALVVGSLAFALVRFQRLDI